MRPIGYSTGALAPGDVPAAFARMGGLTGPGRARAVELSALRLEELGPLIAALPGLDLAGFAHVSVHAPSRFSREEEARLAEALAVFVPLGFPVVLHPDAIHDFAVWRRFGRGLCIENMDRRKPVGRTVLELGRIFDRLPEASFCFDIGHAHQVDRTMHEAYFLLRELGARLAQIHISEVSTRGKHGPLSRSAVMAFRKVADWVPAEVPVVIEASLSAPRLRRWEIEEQMSLAAEALEGLSGDPIAGIGAGGERP